MDAELVIRKEDTPLELHMVEIMELQHRGECDTARQWWVYLKRCKILKILIKVVF